MEYNSCNCNLPQINGNTDCCKNCSNNPNKNSITYIAQNYSISRQCEICGKSTEDIDHHICKTCKDMLIDMMRYFQAQPGFICKVKNDE